MKHKAAKLKSFSFQAATFKGAQDFDFAEFTKSEREKAAEVLFDWRGRDGGQVSTLSRLNALNWRFFAFLLMPQIMIFAHGQSDGVAKRVLNAWLCMHSLLILASLFFIYQ